MSLHVPSGKIFDGRDIDLSHTMHGCGFVRYVEKPFTLKSGIESHVYVFGREDLTDHPALMYRVGRKIGDLVLQDSRDDERTPCLIGIPTAGTVLAVAASVISSDGSVHGRQIACRIMREVKKGHGAHQTWVNGIPDFVHHEYWLVDNVATNGDSKIEAGAKLAEDGYPEHLPCLIWIDRQQGAIQRLKQVGFNRIVVAYDLLDLAYAYGELGLWPKETVQAVEREIAAHQF